MANLNPNSQLLLETCATAMSRRETAPGLNLSLLRTALTGDAADVLKFLAEAVEQFTLGELTVRTADHTLFENYHSHGTCVAVLPRADAPDKVLEWTTGTTLYILESCQDGLAIGVLASPQTIAENRLRQAKWEQQLSDEAEGKAAAAALVQKLYVAIQLVALQTSGDVRRRLEYCIRNGPNYFGLEDAAMASVIMGQDFGSFVAHAVKQDVSAS
jgi:hypothetical protein